MSKAIRAPLIKFLKKWQPRLRLEDWNITIRWATAKELSDADWDAKCTPDIPYKSAKILVADWEHPKEKAQDFEVLVVHELLHLPLTAFETAEGSLQEVAEENHVHILSTLLVALDRGDASPLGRKLPRIASIPSSVRRQNHSSPSKAKETETSPAKEAGHTGSKTEVSQS